MPGPQISPHDTPIEDYKTIYEANSYAVVKVEAPSLGKPKGPQFGLMRIKGA